MSKMGEYSIQRQEELSRRGNGKKHQEPANVPTVFRDQQVDIKIGECIKLGLDEATATTTIVEWNSKQPSPMKIGLVKKRVYFAYLDQQAGST